MADNRERSRMVFEVSEAVKRAIRIRAGLDGGSPADIINAALKVYLVDELALVSKRFPDDGPLSRTLPKN